MSQKLKKVVVESCDDVDASKGENSKTREKSKKSSSRKDAMLKSVARALNVLCSPTCADKSSNGVEAVTGVPFMLCIVATMCSNLELPMSRRVPGVCQKWSFYTRGTPPYVSPV